MCEVLSKFGVDTDHVQDFETLATNATATLIDLHKSLRDLENVMQNVVSGETRNKETT
jgi:hypothetical protein